MQTGYVGPTELGTFGLVGVPVIYIARASTLVDSVLQRQEGLTWTPDANGWPCYMTRLTPRLTLNLAGPILPGLAVVVPVAGNIDTNPDMLIGEVIILDRGTPAAVEACVITTATMNSFTLQQVQFSHPGPVTADFGMVITEQKVLPEGRSTTTLMAWPIARIHSGTGRYGPGRHTGVSDYSSEDYGYAMLNILRTFGGAPLWSLFPLQASSWDALTGNIWIPSGIWLSYFNEVAFRYVAGWSQNNIPDAIKQAVALLAVAMQSNLLPGNITSYKAGDTQIVRAAATILDADTMRNLSSFKAHLFV